ncbi:MAG TPA: ankyrin repeat domain-containing protein [Gammaproteobacteria bacterium]|nr:ankyrin repeat domain-containing protein [Gammaproteobacteria bacterium]
MPSGCEEKKVAEESCLLQGGRRLPTLIFLEQHDNPGLSSFFREILPVLKKQGYKKFLKESLPPRQLDIQYFDALLAPFLECQQALNNFLESNGLREEYNALSTVRDRWIFLAKLGNLPMDIVEADNHTTAARNLAYISRTIDGINFNKEIISTFGFNYFGIEDDSITEELSGMFDALSDEAMVVRDRLMTGELMKHHRAIEEGGTVMSVGFAHLPGLRQHLMENQEESNEYRLIFLTNDHELEPDKIQSRLQTVQASRSWETFRLAQVKLDSSLEGHPNVAARNILKLCQQAADLDHTAEAISGKTQVIPKIPAGLLSRNINSMEELLELLTLCMTKKDGHVLPHPELALRRASAVGKVDIVKGLIANVIDININQPGPDSGKTALMFARENGHGEIVTFLTDYGLLMGCGYTVSKENAAARDHTRSDTAKH